MLPCCAGLATSHAQTVTIDGTKKYQIIDGFGTCNAIAEPWWQQLYFDDLQCSILRMDITPRFKAPYSDYEYDSPWFHNHPPQPGPDGNNVRAYTSAADYTRNFAGQQAKIAVMGPDIDKNIALLDFDGVKGAGQAAQIGTSKAAQLGDFKLYASMWSPAPWVKLPDGNKSPGGGGVMPKTGTAYPFIWNGNFAGGTLDVSNQPLPTFDDRAMGGTGSTSALTQYVRCTAAFLRGFQNLYHVKYYGISIQNEVNFDEFYNSCTYKLSSQYITALKAVRAELDKYPDLKGIRILGPEDLLGNDSYSMWQLGGGNDTTHKNLQYMQNIGRDPAASAAIDTFCVHGYASNGVTAAGSDPLQWKWWKDGWQQSPAPGLPGNVKGFTAYNKKSWMTETSGEDSVWLSPAGTFPSNGGWSVALKIQQALTAGQESAFIYWTFAEGKPAPSTQALTNEVQKDKSAKYVAAKHFFRYIRPNSQRVEAKVEGANSLSASAYVNNASKSVTIVLINAAAQPVTATVALPATATLHGFQAYTSQDKQFWQPSNVSVMLGKAAVPVPAYGVVTLYSGT